MNPNNLPPGSTSAGAGARTGARTGGVVGAGTADAHSFMLNVYGEHVQPGLQGSGDGGGPQPSALAGAGAGVGAVHIQPAPDAPTAPAPLQKQCAGLEFANMKKEEAREEFKEKRRKELLNLGEIDRVKRRKKNDMSMSDNQKYNRRLKMNQDSAAAARHAQDVYVQTLEELVGTAETERVALAMEAANLRAERDELARRLGDLHKQVASAAPAVAAAASSGPETSTFSSTFDANPAVSADTDTSPDPASSALLLRKMMELLDSPETAAASLNDADFARGLFGIMPAPAV